MTTELSWGQAISILLLIVTIIFLSPVLFSLTTNATAASQRAQCSLSIQATVLSDTVTQGFYSPFQIECARRSIRVNEESAVIFAHNKFQTVSRTTPYTYDVPRERSREGQLIRVPSPQRLIAEDNENFTQDLTNALAYEATSCWRLLAEGSSDLLSSQSTFGSMKGCIVCAEITLNIGDEDLDETINISEQFKNITPPIQNNYQSVDSYLYRDAQPSYSETCGAYEWENQELPIRDQETYVVAFYRDGSRAFSTISDVCQAVTVTTVNELAKQCHYMIN